MMIGFFFFSSRRRHTRFDCDWSSDVCSSDLFPHMTVLENIMLAPVKVRGLSAAEASRVARALLERVRIPDKAENYPANLSGGQQQRGATARAPAMPPKILAFAEPTPGPGPEDIHQELGVMTA